MNGEQDAAVFHAAFVALGFVLWDTEANQGTGEAANRAAYAESGQRGHNRPRRDEGPQSRDGQRSDSCEPAQTTADDCASSRARRRAFGRLGSFFVSEIFGS